MARLLNLKHFLAPHSIESMAAVHVKTKTDNTYQLRISDCNRTIKIWGKTDTKEGLTEGLEKLRNLRVTIEVLEAELHLLLDQIPKD